MEENKSGGHKAILLNRKNGSFTGIIDVISFDISAILLETELGMLTIKGKNLHVNRLSLEKGEVDMEGTIVSIEYSEVPKMKEKAGSVMGRLFR